MIPLSSKDNIDNSDANYPFGKSIDDTGTDNGSRVNFERLNDAEQFFEKMFAESGLTANGLPDNDSDGFQLYEAFRQLARPYKVYCVDVTQTGTNAPVPTEFQNEIGIVPGDFVRTGVGTYEIQKTGAFPAGKTAVFINTQGGVGIETRASRTNNDTIFLSSAAAGSATDGALASTLEVRVYD